MEYLLYPFQRATWIPIGDKGNSGATIVKPVFIQDQSRGGGSGDNNTKSCRTGDINGGSTSVCSHGTSYDIMEIILGQ